MSTLQPQLSATHMALFPTLGSVQEVVDYADSKLPISNKNELYSLLMIMRNTVIRITNT